MKRPLPGRYTSKYGWNVCVQAPRTGILADLIKVRADVEVWTAAEILLDLAKIRVGVETKIEKAQTEFFSEKADNSPLKKSTPTPRAKIHVGMYTNARYKYKGEFYNQVFPCQVVAQEKRGWTVKWNDGDPKDTFKHAKDIGIGKV